MCGIIGFIGINSLINVINGLKSLEYRGYDSSGIAFFNNQKAKIIKSIGSIDKLEEKINFNDFKDVKMAIGHTRWATHGKVEIKNSHPFESRNVIILHNGIIENYLELKDFLINNGYKFNSEVDSEVIAHLIDYFYEDKNYIEAIDKAKKQLKGMFSFLVLFKDNPKAIYGIKKDSPLYVGKKDKEIIISSDLIGIINHTKIYYPLLDNEIIECSTNSINIYDTFLNKISRKKATCNLSQELISKQGYKHYMLKEINEEPNIYNSLKNISIDYLKSLIKNKDKVVIIGCGSAYYAGLIGKYLFEELLNIKVNVEIASEFRYSPFIYQNNTLFIFISQSGETADTIAALRLVKSYKIETLGIVNVMGSTIANECDYVISLGIGREIAVASTKAYYAQIIYLYKLCFLFAHENNVDLKELEKEFLEFNLKLLNEGSIKEVANIISKKSNLFFIGRSVDYYLALEGSLKLKEITYIHSEAYPSGELKHGPISLINNNSLIIAILSNKRLKTKIRSNIEEVLSRGAKVILISDTPITNENIINLEFSSLKSDYLSPLTVIPILQLLSYYCAISKGTNIDKPKNLAKSVTVE